MKRVAIALFWTAIGVYLVVSASRYATQHDLLWTVVTAMGWIAAVYNLNHGFQRKRDDT